MSLYKAIESYRAKREQVEEARKRYEDLRTELQGLGKNMEDHWPTGRGGGYKTIIIRGEALVLDSRRVKFEYVHPNTGREKELRTEFFLVENEAFVYGDEE